MILLKTAEKKELDKKRDDILKSKVASSSFIEISLKFENSFVGELVCVPENVSHTFSIWMNIVPAGKNQILNTCLLMRFKDVSSKAPAAM